MRHTPLQVMHAARHGPAARPQPRLVIAGATGVLGNEVVRLLVGSSAFRATEVLAREPMTAGVRGISTRVVPGEDPAQWPATQADAGVVLFEPPRMFYQRERALWTPQPQQLPALAAWLRRSGVATLAIVLPHAPGRLPEALKRGLASLDEHAVAALGFERLIIIRSATPPGQPAAPHPLARVAHGMLAVLKYMVPSSEQPVRAAKVAQLLAVALQTAPHGIHVAAPETVWRAAQGAQLRRVAAQWLRPGSP